MYFLRLGKPQKKYKAEHVVMVNIRPAQDGKHFSAFYVHRNNTNDDLRLPFQLVYLQYNGEGLDLGWFVHGDGPNKGFCTQGGSGQSFTMYHTG